MIEDQIKTEAVDIPKTPTAQQAEQAVPQTAEIADPYAVTDEMKAQATKGVDAEIEAWRAFSESLPALETEEQRKQREKREKSRKVISAVSDGLAALGNLYFTTKYAPNMYNHEKQSASKAEQARIDKAKADREANREAHLKFALGLGKAEAEKARTLRELEAAQEKRREAAEKAKREAELHPLLVAIRDAQGRKENGLADKAESDAAAAKVAAEYADEMQAAKLDTEKARAGAQRASASNSNASAAAHNRSNVPEFSAWDEHGNEHKFSTKAAAEVYAKQHGTWKEEDEMETTTIETKRSPTSLPQSRKSTKTKEGGHAGKPSPTGRKSPTA